MNEKDLYTAILSVLQSHFDSTRLNNVAVVANPESANRAMQAHRIGQDAVNDWLSAKLRPERLEFVGMMRG